MIIKKQYPQAHHHDLYEPRPLVQLQPSPSRAKCISTSLSRQSGANVFRQAQETAAGSPHLPQLRWFAGGCWDAQDSTELELSDGAQRCTRIHTRARAWASSAFRSANGRIFGCTLHKLVNCADFVSMCVLLTTGIFNE